jgi:hypothetical protein
MVGWRFRLSRVRVPSSTPFNQYLKSCSDDLFLVHGTLMDAARKKIEQRERARGATQRWSR